MLPSLILKEVKCLNKCSHTKMLLWNWVLRFMASVPCAVGMINTVWLSEEVVGREHLLLGAHLVQSRDL